MTVFVLPSLFVVHTFSKCLISKKLIFVQLISNAKCYTDIPLLLIIITLICRTFLIRKFLEKFELGLISHGVSTLNVYLPNLLYFKNCGTLWPLIAPGRFVATLCVELEILLITYSRGNCLLIVQDNDHEISMSWEMSGINKEIIESGNFVTREPFGLRQKKVNFRQYFILL